MPATTGIKALFFRVAHAAKFRYLKKGRKVSELMSRAKIYPMVQAILSSVLFGASAPIAKLLLGQIEPVVLAAFLYLGSGIGLLLFKGFRRMWLHCGEVEARISSTDIPWLIGSILAGGVLAPIVLMFSLPNYKVMLLAMLLGCLSYGASIILFIMAMRNLGAVRTSALFGTAPFTGALLSFALFKDLPGIPFFIALPFMIIGAALLLSEEHTHNHCHAMINHEHRHSHEDGHHKHQHPNDAVSRNACHSHFHIHDAVEHSHHHTPDIHHWHNH